MMTLMVFNFCYVIAMNNVEKNFLLFFKLNMSVRLIHPCDLYSNKYGKLLQLPHKNNLNC